MSFSCVGAGSFHQGDLRFPPFSRNRQCVANAACAIAWKFLGGNFTSPDIDEILMTGDRMYQKSRLENNIEDDYLEPEDLTRELDIMNRTLPISEILYVTGEQIPEDSSGNVHHRGVRALSCLLDGILDRDSDDGGFLYLRAAITVAFWRFQGRLYLFDSHAVNGDRQWDSNSERNRARLFLCDNTYALASLLLINADLDSGNAHRHTIEEVKFGQPIDRPQPMDVDESETGAPQASGGSKTFHSEPQTSANETAKKGRGRPKKIKRGRPKTLTTTQSEQIVEAKRRYREKHPEVYREAARRYSQERPEVNREAVRRYSQENPEVNREAVRRYSQENPEVNRESVRRYAKNHPEVNREAVSLYQQNNPEVHREAVRIYDLRHPDAVSQRVQTFRTNNPRLSELRHLPAQFARQIVNHGPMAYWSGELLDLIQPFKLKITSLWDPNIYRCPHCKARLFEEERERKKWCCGGGAYNVHNFSPLDASFYSDKEFLQRARAYNDLFAFCALEVSGGYRHPSGLSFFKIEGRMYHQIYNLEAQGQRFTARGGAVQFVNRCRLYIDDGQERRNIAMGRSLNVGIIDAITNHLNTCNPYIHDFRRLGNEPSVDANLTFEVTNRSTHGPVLGDRQMGLEVHAVLGTDDTNIVPQNLTIWKKDQPRPRSISLFNPLMEPFQYPLLYPRGELGWHVNAVDNTGRKLSQYKYARCLLLSEPRFCHLGRLSQAWQVEMFARYEEEKLRYIKYCQTKPNSRNDTRISTMDELLQVQRGGSAVDQQVANDIRRDETIQGEGGVQAGKIVLPFTVTGCPRYMRTRYENAMGLVSRLGTPTFFLTFTYSATWEENKKACPHNSGRSDPATACRVFYIKLLELLRDLRSGAMFGRTTYIVHVIEMQMRGLPHAHIVFKMDGDGPTQAAEIDSVIRADIPSAGEAGGRLRKLVLRHMIHGPCGTDHRTDFLCWDSAKGCCSKFFPKPSCQTTHIDDRGFVVYRRDYANEGAIGTGNRTVTVHDGWVVPYNPALLLKYEAHINLEIASTRRVIKYLFKYLMKGGSLQNVTVTPLGQQEDEVEYYATRRMIGASDACWRLLNFPITESEPAVECLPVHLEGKHDVRFRPDAVADAIANANSKLMVYFKRPLIPALDNVTYSSFYEQYIVHTKRPTGNAEYYECVDGKRFVTARQRGSKVCRLWWILPSRGEIYYLRILLMSTPCRGYADLLSRGGPDCRTFQEVARNLGMVEDEDEYHHALREASTFMLGPRLRSFFVLLCNMGAPAALLWERFRNSLCEDHIDRNPLDPELAIKLSLLEIDRSLRRQGTCLTDHGLPEVEDDTTELGRELLNFGVNHQGAIVEEWLPRLSDDQHRVFDYVRSLCLNPGDRESSRIIFLDGPGGYGKTSLLRLILAFVRSCGQVALAVASSGIAAGNMPGGTTAHSMFRLPLGLGDGTGVWNVTNGSQRADLIRAAQLIIFDEAPMAHRYIFEILDRSLRDLTNSDVPFGGKIFICSGDFRQIAPVVERARTPADIACVSLRASHLWRSFRVFSLTTPHRTSTSVDYSDFLLSVGNGTVVPESVGEGRDRQFIPLRGLQFVTSMSDLILQIYPVDVLREPDTCARRAILSTLNANVKRINDTILDRLDGRLHELRSADVVDRDDDDGLDVDIQILNQSTGKGVPDHVLRLKIGSVCLIMRNLNIADGLVNGTKVIVTAISNRLITVRLPNSNQPIGIPRIIFRFAVVEGSPLRVRRRQFPLVLAYAMTGHKSQGQTIERAGVDLRTDCFTHGQLYVLLSRVRSPDDIVILVQTDKVKDGVAFAKNIVYDDLLL